MATELDMTSLRWSMAKAWTMGLFTLRHTNHMTNLITVKHDTTHYRHMTNLITAQQNMTHYRHMTTVKQNMTHYSFMANVITSRHNMTRYSHKTKLMTKQPDDKADHSTIQHDTATAWWTWSLPNIVWHANHMTNLITSQMTIVRHAKRGHCTK